MKEDPKDYIISIWGADGTKTEHIVIALNDVDAEKKAIKMFSKKAFTIKRA